MNNPYSTLTIRKPADGQRDSKRDHDYDPDHDHDNNGLTEKMDLETLKSIKKPARYLGTEHHAVRVPKKGDLRVGLAFPDLYEIGMSHLGISILYHCLNHTPGIFSERIFWPDEDLEALLRRHGHPLTTLETKTPLHQLDILGFSLAYELTYTNLLGMLDLGGLPLRSTQRELGRPLVIAGGPCAFNPEPLSHFVDAFVIGEAEFQLIEVCRLVKTWKSSGDTKQELLKALDRLPGLYVPALFEFQREGHETRGRLIPLTGRTEPVNKCFVPDLNGAAYPDHPLVPYTRIVHDRVCIESARGCPHHCRFCQANMIYRPYRERHQRRIWELARESLNSTGYEDLSLLALSIGDYSSLGSLICLLMTKLAPEKVALSLPSIRVGSLPPAVVEEILKVRKTGFTLAPEAATERLRNVINKDIQEAELVQTAQLLARLGWRSLKLYFMIGLPTETDKDIEEIVFLAKAIQKAARKEKSGQFQLTVNISTFVPKAHTAFQWEGQISREAAEEKQKFLKKRLQGPGIRVKWHDARLSMLEGLFARGDRRIGDLLEKAYGLGCRRDGWSEHLRFDLWEKAIEQLSVDCDAYLKPFDGYDSPLPWDWISTGVPRSFLVKEHERALKGELYPFKCLGRCEECGLCRHEVPVSLLPGDPAARKSASSDMPGQKADTGSLSAAAHSHTSSPVSRIRVRYAKQGAAVCLSHLETLNIFQRALRRTGLPICFTEGEHPHPKIAFSQALPVGVESLAEYIDLWFTNRTDRMEVTSILNAELPEGLTLISAHEIALNAISLEKSIVWADYEIQFYCKSGQHPDRKKLEKALYIFSDRDRLTTEDKRSGNAVDHSSSNSVYPIRLELMPNGDGLLLRCHKRSGAMPSPMRVIESFWPILSSNGLQPKIRKTRTMMVALLPVALLDKRGSRHGK